MRCRWMLALEEQEKAHLRLLAGIPRAWLDDQKKIAVRRMKTYYGDLSFTVKSNIASGRIHVKVELDNTGALPVGTVSVRLPHPHAARAKQVTAGRYDPDTETVILERFSHTAEFDLIF